MAIGPVPRVLARRPGPSLWACLAVGISVVLAMPIAAVVSSLAVPAGEVWLHLWRTQLLELIGRTLLLLLGVGTGALIVGGGLAWLVVHHRFPGRVVLEWALILPLAVPAYVIGFAFVGLFEYAGPVQSALRRALGAGVALPEIRSYAGIVAMMTLVFYPYVYLLARVAFREQGAAAVETARTLGRSRAAAFVQITVPMARPALVAGVALAMMEALADFGTVATFGYRTLTEAIYRVWYGMFDRIAAAQLASVLLLFAAGLLLLERRSRGRARFTQSGRRGPVVEAVRLSGWRAAGATTACVSVLALAFLLPVGQLAWWAIAAIRAGQVAPDFVALLWHTCALAGTTAAVASLLAVLLAYAGRLHGTAAVRVAAQLSSMGYALPGAVIAVGVLLPLAWADHALVPSLERALGRPLGLLLTGSAAGLVLAYVVRFLAVGLQTVDASLGKIPPSLDDAARVLGARAGSALRRVHLPLMRGGLLTAVVLVFVETMKEMPATLLLRPVGLNTLAVEIWERTSEAMWPEAAVPALTLVGVGLLPVVLLIRLTSRR
jgi:iron(III) transport system permease protein